MALITKETGDSDFTIVPEGTHLAMCNMIVDLGLQRTTYQGDEKIKPQIYIRWELPSERITYKVDGQEREGPMTIGSVYTNSLGKKAYLRRDLEAWRGRAFTSEELQGFDLTTILGKPCQVTVTHRESNGKTYANVTGVAGWPKGMEPPRETENKLVSYDADLSPDLGFDDLPEWLQRKIGERVQERATQPQDDVIDDSIPF